ncbi:MAG TPA: hypothetical protein VD886_24965 [Herpetosiphonaceae bacterium]|nr:hypothetical protein [Herpetosiphonaceae bacterium]
MRSDIDPLTLEGLIAFYANPHPVWDTTHLRGIDTVDWAALSHAHGLATDVPPLLRALLSDEPDHREFACVLLHETVWHQGTIYQASSHVVPFLLQMLRVPDLPAKMEVLALLGSIASGGPGILADSDWAREAYAKHGRNFEAAVAEWAEYAQQAYAAVWSGLDAYVGFYSDPDPMIRRCVTNLICLLPASAAPDVLPVLETQLSEQTDPDIRADILSQAASFFTRNQLINTPLLDSFVGRCRDRAFNQNEDVRVRFASALTALKVSPQQADDQLIQAVLDGAAAPERLVDQQDPYFSTRIDLHTEFMLNDVARTFAGLPTPYRVPAFLRMLERATNPDGAHTIGAMILGIAMAGVPIAIGQNYRPGRYEDRLLYSRVRADDNDGIEDRIYPNVCSNAPLLTPAQRQAVATVVRNDAIWTIRSNLFAAFGLPNDRETLQSLVG